jgi:hypothetical protein
MNFLRTVFLLNSSSRLVLNSTKLLVPSTWYSFSLWDLCPAGSSPLIWSATNKVRWESCPISLFWRLLDLPYIDLNKVDLHHLSTEIAAGTYEKAGFRTQAWSLPLGCLLCKPSSSEESFSTLVLERQRQSLLSKSTNLMDCSHLLTSLTSLYLACPILL